MRDFLAPSFQDRKRCYVQAQWFEEQERLEDEENCVFLTKNPKREANTEVSTASIFSNGTLSSSLLSQDTVETVEEVGVEEESYDPLSLGLGSLTVSNIRSLANTQVYTVSIFTNVTS